jgi:hypothetical protein
MKRSFPLVVLPDPRGVSIRSAIILAHLDDLHHAESNRKLWPAAPGTSGIG